MKRDYVCSHDTYTTNNIEYATSSLWEQRRWDNVYSLKRQLILYDAYLAMYTVELSVSYFTDVHLTSHSVQPVGSTTLHTNGVT